MTISFTWRIYHHVNHDGLPLTHPLHMCHTVSFSPDLREPVFEGYHEISLFLPKKH